MHDRCLSSAVGLSPTRRYTQSRPKLLDLGIKWTTVRRVTAGPARQRENMCVLQEMPRQQKSSQDYMSRECNQCQLLGLWVDPFISQAGPVLSCWAV